MQPKDKIMWMSDSPMLTTGFATMSWNVMNLLSKKYEGHYLCAHNYAGQLLPPGVTFTDGTKLDFYVHGVGKEQYCKDIITQKIRQYRPKVFGILLDTFMVYPWFLNTDTAPAKTLFYFPSDGGGGLPAGCDQILKRVDMPIAMSRHGQKQVKKVHDINAEYIPHACNPDIFHKVSDEERIKLKTKFGLQNKFVVGCVARNQGRKMLDREVKSFALFCRDKPDAVLYMHSDPKDPAAPFDILKLISDLGIQNRVLWSGYTFWNNVTYEQMREIYNIMDIFFLSTSGEGFGVPTIEAQACGVPVVVTDYTTTQELLIEDGQSGLPVKLVGDLQPTLEHHPSEIVDGTVMGNWNVERGLMDIFDGAKQLTKLYDDAKLREKLGKVGIRKVSKLYTWDAVNPLWEKAIDKLIK